MSFFLFVSSLHAISYLEMKQCPNMSTEFTREVTDTQMPLVAPVILPEMYKIFTMAEVSPQLFCRSQTVLPEKNALFLLGTPIEHATRGLSAVAIIILC